MRPKTQINRADLRTLAESVGALRGVRTLTELQASVFFHLDRIVPGCVISLDQLDISPLAHTVVLNHQVARANELLPRFTDLLKQGHHPYVQYLQAGGQKIAHRTTDMVPMTKFRRNPILDEVYGPSGIPYGMFSALRLPEASRYINFAQLRDRNFTDVEQALSEAYLEQVGRVVAQFIRGSIEVGQAFAANCALLKLTPCETHVMTRIFRGRTNKEIAADLEKSVRTVDAQIRGIFAKLRVGTRSAAIKKILDARPFPGP